MGFATDVTTIMTLPLCLVSIYSIHFVCESFLDVKTNKCIIYGEIFHLDWCSSRGFKEGDEEMADLAAKLDLDAQRKSMKQSLKDAMQKYSPFLSI